MVGGMIRSMENAQRRLIREFQKLGDKWSRELQELPQRWFDELQQEMSKWTQALLKDAFNPAKMMEFLRTTGLDLSRLSQMFGRMAQTGTIPGFDPYVVLGLDRSASDEQVRRAYRDMMMKIHPDRAGKEMNFLATLVNAAYKAICKERGI